LISGDLKLKKLNRQISQWNEPAKWINEISEMSQQNWSMRTSHLRRLKNFKSNVLIKWIDVWIDNFVEEEHN